MARGFRRRGKGPALRYVARLDPAERVLVAGLMEQTYEILAPPERPEVGGEDEFSRIVSGLGGLGMGVSVAEEDQGEWPDSGPVPEDARSFGGRDPALERLVPAGNREDDEAATEFRRLTEDGLRRRKSDNLRRSVEALRGAGDALELDEAGALAMLVALTDVRLVLGERMGLREDGDVERLERVVAELGTDDPIAYAVAVYDFLTWFQETLASAMMPGLPKEGRDDEG